METAKNRHKERRFLGVNEQRIQVIRCLIYSYAIHSERFNLVLIFSVFECLIQGLTTKNMHVGLAFGCLI